MRSWRNESKPCFELPANLKANSPERPRMTDECIIKVTGTYLCLRGATRTFLVMLDTGGRFILVYPLGYKISTHFQALSSLIKHQSLPGAFGDTLLLHLLPIKPTWLLPTAGLWIGLHVEYQWHAHRTTGAIGPAETGQNVRMGEWSLLDFLCGIKESWQVKGTSKNSQSP